jgi:glutathione peroxidase
MPEGASMLKTFIAGRLKAASTNTLAAIAVGALIVALPASAQHDPGSPRRTPAPWGGQSGGTVTSFYDLKTMSLDGKPGNLAQYKGKVSLVVNVASKCGYTPQYEGLEKLQREMKGKGFNVLGFPSNDFGGQEPGTAQEIATFCKLTYDVTFPMFEKVVTKKGPGQSLVYSFLGATGNLPAWNFSKYVVDKQGKVVAFFPSEVTPDDPSLRAAIAKAITN